MVQYNKIIGVRRSGFRELITRGYDVYIGKTDKGEINYPKYVLSMDKINHSQNGIIHKNIIDFLLEKV